MNNPFQLPLVADDAEAWREGALCAQTDPEAFFPEKGGSTRDAKKVCVKCDVREQCLAYALENNERHGIWGGLSERERRKLAGVKERTPKDACVHGHEFTAENTRHTTYTRNGKTQERRVCRTCERDAANRRRAAA